MVRPNAVVRKVVVTIAGDHIAKDWADSTGETWYDPAARLTHGMADLSSAQDAVDALIQRCLAGDQDAWAQIVRQHWRKVFNIAYKFTGKHDEAEDLTQDVFLKIFKSLDTFDRRANFQTWLVSVSRNLCIDHYRSVRKERETIDRGVDPGELTPAAPTLSPIAALEQADRVTLVEEGAGASAADVAIGGAAARHPGTVIPGNRRPAASAGGHRQVPHQPRPHRTGAADSPLAG